MSILTIFESVCIWFLWLEINSRYTLMFLNHHSCTYKVKSALKFPVTLKCFSLSSFHIYICCVYSKKLLCNFRESVLKVLTFKSVINNDKVTGNPWLYAVAVHCPTATLKLSIKWLLETINYSREL